MASTSHGQNNVGYVPEVSVTNSEKKIKIKNGINSREEPSIEQISHDLKNPERATWGKSIEFLMSCIAMNVGLGNIWRFPFVCYENGGGAFLIPYILVLIFMGRPIYYMEMCLGQFSSRGNVKMFQSLAPVLKGLGYGQFFATCCVAVYYCALMALTLFYLINSFRSNLPWSSCDPSWHTIEWLQNVTCIPSKSHPGEIEVPNGTTTMSSSELYFRVEVLKEKIDISDGIGLPEWRLSLCLLISWAVTFSICAKGVQSSGKASYFLALFPYVILFTLLLRAVTLPGAGTGILYFITPKWEKLLEAKVWYAAVTQCFFSLNIGFGSVTMYASYNNFRHNVYRDAMIVTSMDTCTSLLAGTIIFGILGNLSYKMGVDVSEVIKSGGTGLAFISYPEAIARFDAVPWLFAILFFVMLFVLGIGSLVALQGCAFTVIMDSFPHLKVWHVSITTAVGGFLVGLVFVTPGGQWIFTMVDYFGGTFIYFVLNNLEVIAIFWWYGLEEICLDIQFMLKRKTGSFFRICWTLIIPVFLFLIFFYTIFTMEELKYEKRSYPAKIIAWGWAILGFGIIQPVIWFCIELVRKRRKFKVSYKQACSMMFQHTSWGPKDLSLKAQWLDFKNLQHSTRELKFRSKIKEKFYILIGRK